MCTLGLARRAGGRPDRLPSAEADERRRCAWGTPTQRSPEMLHVWLIRHPQGPFGTRMYLPLELVQEELEKRDRARERALRDDRP